MRSATIDETRTVEVYLFLEYLGSIGNAIEHLEVFVRTFYDIGILEIFDNGTHELDGLASMIAAEIDIVVDDGTRTACFIEQGFYLVAHLGVEGIVGAEEDDVVALYRGTLPIVATGEGFLIEGVGGIVRDFLRDNGVDDRYLTEYPDCKSPISLAFLDKENNATYSFYKEPFARCTDWECPTIGRDDIVLFGSYYALNPAMRYKVTTLLDEARRAGAIVYYDVNFRRNHADEAIKLMGTVIENLE